MRKWRFYLCSKNSKIREIMKNETEKQTINAAEKHNPLVIVDNGHGMQTPGKRSPGGSVLEWEWTRRVAGEIVGRLSKTPVDAVLLVPEDDDIPLPTRCRRARRLAEGRCAVLLSVHVNASGDGSSWRSARGFSAFVAERASTESVRLARMFTSMACRRGLAGNRSVPPEGCWRGNFAIVRDTPMPAVLTENLFMDNREDAAILMSATGFEDIVSMHVDAVLKFFNICL